MAEEKNNRSEKLETLDHQIRDIINPVSYTHLTLPTNSLV